MTKRYKIVNYRRFVLAVSITAFVICLALNFGFLAIKKAVSTVYALDAIEEPSAESLQEECKEITPSPELEIVEEPAEPEEPAPIYYNVPFDHEMQDLVRQACEESGIDMKLCLAVIQKETSFRNIMGDNGNSYGYMQIQKKWHQARMDKLGVTDLMDPLGNFRVGCDLLAAHLSYLELEDALTKYNSGHTGASKYAATVIEYMNNMEVEQ